MSDKQRKFYFSLCQLVANELGWDSSNQVHSVFKDKFLPYNRKSTTELVGKEVEEYLLRVQSFITQELGFRIDES
jgi:hypothetical protein